LPLDAVRAFITMQPMVWYQPALADALGVPPERLPSTYTTYAHIGGCAVVANLIEARARGLLADGVPVVLYAHGAGITRYAALVRWSSPNGTSRV
jgi:3-oxoacyl-[acyl-carrier-protein] synthase III